MEMLVSFQVILSRESQTRKSFRLPLALPPFLYRNKVINGQGNLCSHPDYIPKCMLEAMAVKALRIYGL